MCLSVCCVVRLPPSGQQINQCGFKQTECALLSTHSLYVVISGSFLNSEADKCHVLSFHNRSVSPTLLSVHPGGLKIHLWSQETEKVYFCNTKWSLFFITFFYILIFKWINLRRKTAHNSYPHYGHNVWWLVTSGHWFILKDHKLKNTVLNQCNRQ